MKRLFFFHFLLWILPGCSLLPSTLVSSSPSSPSVLPAPSYPLLSPATYGRSYVAQHLLEGQAHGEDFTLQIHVEIDPDRILLLGFTPWQTRAFVLRYDGTTVDFENFTNREMPFPPARILSDLQQVLWPNLPNHNEWHVVDDPQTHERRVTFQDRLITRIRYQGVPPMQGVVELDNVALGYQLRIHIREDEPEQPQN
jgi:Protein of unknown function (DUF3261)